MNNTQIKLLLYRIKHHSYVPTEAESAAIKFWVVNTIIQPGTDDQSILESIQLFCPCEYGEAIAEIEANTTSQAEQNFPVSYQPDIDGDLEIPLHKGKNITIHAEGDTFSIVIKYNDVGISIDTYRTTDMVKGEGPISEEQFWFDDL